MRHRLVAALLLVASPAWAAPCYTQADLARVTPAGLRVIQQALPPSSDTTASNYFPATEFVDTNLQTAQTSTFTGALMSASVWRDRSTASPYTQKPNPPDGPRVSVIGAQGTWPCYSSFPTQAQADASFQSKIAYVGGRWYTHNGKGWLDFTEAAGIPDANVLEWPAFASGAPTICPGNFFSNSTGSFYFQVGDVIESGAKLSTVPTMPHGCIQPDWEAQDEETASEANSIIAATAQNVHAMGYCYRLYTNPLDSISAQRDGFDATNLNWVLSKVDQMSVFPYPSLGAGDSYLASFNRQMAMLTAPPCSKLSLTVDMAMSISDATALRAAAIDPVTAACPVGGVEVWPDEQTPGGDCSSPYNQKLAILLGIAP